MDITWYGHSCFKVTERNYITIVTDPFDEALGYALPKLKADIVTVSHDAPGHNNLAAVKGFRHVIDGPGEYEIGGVFVIAVAMHHPDEPARQNIVYVLDFDGLNVLHLGDLSYVPTQSEVETLGAVNVALVPVGGGNALNASQAAEVISLIEPDIIIPMHYKTPHTPLELEPLDKFLKVMGLGNVQPQEMLRISAAEMPEQPQVVVLEPQQS